MNGKISIEGSIGSGKSTLVEKIKQKGIHALTEPVEKWREYESDGLNILALFYQNPKRWAYTFQTIVFKSRIIQLFENPKDIIYERSPLTDNNVFAKACHQNGYMTDMEYKLYLSWSNFMIDEFKALPRKIIYIRTSPKVCLERINKRKRPEEASIDIEYLEQIHQLHEEWLSNTNIPVLIIDNENSKDNWDDEINDIIKFCDL